MMKDKIKIIKDIKKAIKIKEASLIMTQNYFSSTFWISLGFMIVISILCLPKFLKSEFFFNQKPIIELIILFHGLVLLILALIISLETSKYKTKKHEKNYKDEIKKYIKHSKEELLKLKDKHVKEIILNSVNNDKLFRFIILDIEDKNIKKELLNYCYSNKDILQIICEDNKLLSIVSEATINDETELFLTNIQKYLEEEDRKKQKINKLKKSIRKKIENTVEKEKIKIL